jgi:hypothetical protein
MNSFAPRGKRKYPVKLKKPFWKYPPDVDNGGGKIASSELCCFSRFWTVNINFFQKFFLAKRLKKINPSLIPSASCG